MLGSSQNGRERNVGQDRNQGRWSTVSLGHCHCMTQLQPAFRSARYHSGLFLLRDSEEQLVTECAVFYYSLLWVQLWRYKVYGLCDLGTSI